MPKLFRKEARVSFLYGDAVYKNLSACRVVEAHQKINQRCFSAACWSDNRDSLAMLRMEMEVFNQLFIWRVGEADILKADAAQSVFKRFCAGGVRLFGIGIQKFKNTRRAGQRILKFRNHAGNFIERLCVLVGIAKKRGKTAHGHRRARADTEKIRRAARCPDIRSC